MKFHLNHDPANKTLTIPRAALQLSGLAETSDLTIHTENGCVLLLPEKLSVAQTLKTFQLLTAINAELLFRLAKSSALAHGAENDACDGCHWEKECFQDVLPLCMLAEAGISPTAALESFVEEGRIIVQAAMKTAADVLIDELDDDVRTMLEDSGVQLEGVCRLLEKEEISE